MITIRAVPVCPSQLTGSSRIPTFVSRSLARPSVAKICRNTSEYDTRPTAHGRKIAVRQNPLNFSHGALSRFASTIASTSMIGTWMIR